jgi:two-component sensor histidine kinase
MHTHDNELGAPDFEEWVLLVAPFRDDERYLQHFLSLHGIAARSCTAESALSDMLAQQPWTVVLTQEAFTAGNIETIGASLADQPEWSDIPFIVLLDADKQTNTSVTTLQTLLPSKHLTVMQRPIRTAELLTGIRSSLAARRRQLHVRDYLDMQETMQRELNHRVKNILSNVYAVYHMTVQQSASLEAFRDTFEGRLSALVRVHSMLAASGFRETPLAEIAAQTLAPYTSAQSPERVQIAGAELSVGPASATTVGLCIHELATNAAKYGAFSVAEGRVSLNWRLTDAGGEPAIELVWEEAGGPGVAAPTRQGFGTMFVNSAIRGLRGQTEFHFLPSGLRCVLRMPVASVAA